MKSDEKETLSFGQRYGFALGIAGLLLLIGVIFAAQSLFKKGPKPRRDTGFTMVQLPPQPLSTPPPTPPPIQQEQEQKMVEQAPVTEEDTKPEQPKEAPPDLGTGITGNGPDAFGLSGRGSGGIGRTGSAGSHSKWGWYAAQVQSGIADALRRNKRTRSANLRVTVRVWPDASGRITRAKLGESTGDAALDKAIANDVLAGLQLQEPPPAGMPTPIVLRITAHRPN
jgi:TonB family protein